jgi:hypothetical protein
VNVRTDAKSPRPFEVNQYRELETKSRKLQLHVRFGVERSNETTGASQGSRGCGELRDFWVSSGPFVVPLVLTFVPAECSSGLLPGAEQLSFGLARRRSIAARASSQRQVAFVRCRGTWAAAGLLTWLVLLEQTIWLEVVRWRVLEVDLLPNTLYSGLIT